MGLLAGWIRPTSARRCWLSARAAPRGARPKPAAAWLRFGSAMARTWPVAVARWAGGGHAAAGAADAKDKRFADPAWEEQPWSTSRCGRPTWRQAARRGPAGRGQGDPLTDQKAQLAMGFAFDALAPTNFLATNPAALKKAFDTGGASVLAGRQELPRRPRAQRRHARARSTPRRSSSAATSPPPRAGRVPQRPDGADPVRPADRAGARRPAAGQPAVDQQVLRHGLAPGRSFIEWAVTHQRTVFAISTATRTPRWPA